MHFGISLWLCSATLCKKMCFLIFVSASCFVHNFEVWIWTSEASETHLAWQRFAKITSYWFHWFHYHCLQLLEASSEILRTLDACGTCMKINVFFMDAHGGPTAETTLWGGGDGGWGWSFGCLLGQTPTARMLHGWCTIQVCWVTIKKGWIREMSLIFWLSLTCFKTIRSETRLEKWILKSFVVRFVLQN